MEASRRGGALKRELSGATGGVAGERAMSTEETSNIPGGSLGIDLPVAAATHPRRRQRRPEMVELRGGEVASI